MLKRLAAIAALTTAPAAQDLEVDVQRDPDAGLAIYTLDLQGPPGGGVYLIFGSFSLSPFPFPLPDILGNVHLDPLSAFTLGGLSSIPPSGQAQKQFQVDIDEFAHLNIYFQELVVDTNFTLALTPYAAAVQGAAPLPDCNLQWTGTYKLLPPPGTYTLELFGGPPNANVRLLVNGGQKAEGLTILDGDGKGKIVLPVGLAPGDGLTIEKNGQAVHGWTW